MSLLPPGRFLMPGSLAGSPALTFAPLDVPRGRRGAGRIVMGDDATALSVLQGVSWCGRSSATISRGSIARWFWSMRSPRSIPGRARCSISRPALAGILDCFRVGRGTILNALFRPRIDRILFAATKADHLHHSSHDRSRRCCRRAVARAVTHAKVTGAHHRRRGARRRPRHPRGASHAQPGQPAVDPGHADRGRKRERRDVRRHNTEVATYPGELPDDPQSLFESDTRLSRPRQRAHRGRLSFPALPAATHRGWQRSRIASHPP